METEDSEGNFMKYTISLSKEKCQKQREIFMENLESYVYMRRFALSKKFSS